MKAGHVCRPCARRWIAEQRRARRTACRARLRGIEGAALRVCAAGVHVGGWARLVQLYKAEPERGLQSLVHRFALERWRNAALRVASRGEDGAAGSVLWVPAPMAAVRRRERGRNPPEDLARLLAGAVGGVFAPGLLVRRRYRRPLRGLGREERRLEMEGAVAATKEAAAAAGRTAILIDDVLTTGATLCAAASALREAGIETSLALVLSRTPPRARRTD